MKIRVFDLSAIPLFNEDVRLQRSPPAGDEFKDRIAAADALLIAVPEYNCSMSGALKNAIEWASRPPDTSPLSDKPVVLMGAGGGLGTARAQDHFRQVAVFPNMYVLNRPEVLVPFAQKAFDDDGKPTEPRIPEKVHQLLIALAEWTVRLRVK